MSKPVDISGCRFGRLLAVERAPSEYQGNGRVQWLCRCDCGASFITDSHRLRLGNTTSCGCFKQECLSANGKKNTVHGLSKTGIGKTWSAMLYRCYSENSISYPWYGAKGVKVCEFIRVSPLNLRALVGDRPNGSTIDRKNPYGHYSCGECAECLKNGWPLNIRWATAIEQGRNKTNSRMLEIDGVVRCVAEWESVSGLHRSIINQRLARGWSGKRLLQPPVRTRNQHTP